MESRTTRSGKQLISMTDVGLWEIGEGDHGPPHDDKTSPDDGDAVTNDHHDISDDIVNPDMMIDRVNSTPPVVDMIAPMMRDAVHSMESNMRHAMNNIEVILADARQRDAKEMGRTVSNTIGPILQDVMDIFARRQDPTNLGQIVTDALGPVINHLVHEVRNTLSDVHPRNEVPAPVDAPNNGRPPTDHTHVHAARPQRSKGSGQGPFPYNTGNSNRSMRECSPQHVEQRSGG